MEEALKIKNQVEKFDNARVLQLVAYQILGIVLDFIGKKVIPKYPPPLGTLRKKFTKWAKEMVTKAVHSAPPEPSLPGRKDTPDGTEPFIDEREARDEDPFDPDEGKWGKIFDVKLPSGLAKNLPPTEALGHANIILDFVHFKARRNDIPGANSIAFYMKPMVDFTQDTHVAEKYVVQLSVAGSVEAKNSNPNSLFNIFTSTEVSKYGHLIGRKFDNYTGLINEDGTGIHRLNQAKMYQELKKRGLDRLIRTMDQMASVMRYWFTSPDTLCCLIRLLGGIGAADKSILYGIRTILIYFIDKEKEKVQYVFDDLSGILNALVLTLISKISGVLESISQRVTGRISLLINSIQDDAVVAGCSPLDELLGTLKGAIQGIVIEIDAFTGALLGDLALRDSKLQKTTANLERKQRLERFLKIVDVIINALETGELCSEVQDSSTGVPVPPPTIEEIERFLFIGVLPEFEDSQRSRNYIIEKYGRDPVTGQAVDRLIVTDSVLPDIERIRKSLDECSQRVNREAVEDIVKQIKERGVI